MPEDVIAAAVRIEIPALRPLDEARRRALVRAVAEMLVKDLREQAALAPVPEDEGEDQGDQS